MASLQDGTQTEASARRPAGALEAEVMAALWASDGAMTAAAVHQAVGGDLAYKTVLTVLGRLHAKGLVDRESAGRAHAYTPRQAAAEAAAEQMNAALRRGPQPAEVLQRFVDTLDADEHAALRALLEARD
ncbi:BlaI/MecI/CopY family transcriptional regulator [Streptomyces mirabilis]|uniref:BlaI/MecI/CopY family transcriptional regulator n=1 Tax=Streptomyces mirabilis TaxID=68239 RepID=UPI00225AD325|nr:BlaI/MecI/CopY family transcriptional regulator [Streptomyces mirabilis]MCX4425893.1 BlaI/MecI/CopY family transcriptional regulator [Streptomyces mirabilis]MCX4429352.1 BlaI/MecI/CopY family transcriptional regulator [Streptomyces mirabilis]